MNRNVFLLTRLKLSYFYYRKERSQITSRRKEVKGIHPFMFLFVILVRVQNLKDSHNLESRINQKCVPYDILGQTFLDF